jgi:dTDP-4-dehydrorhamnose reductase
LQAQLAHHRIEAPARSELDVADEAAVRRVFERFHPGLVIHAAALIRTRGTRTADERRAMSRVNVLGTGLVSRRAEAVGARLVHVSTDFVFDGEKPGGMYREDDIPCALGYYPLTKLAAEPLALGHPDSLVVRLSFNASWPYPKAFTDRFTSKLPAERAARELALASFSSLTGVLHIGGPRQSYFDFARTLAPNVQPMTIADVVGDEPLPRDTSLDSSRWRGHQHA